jgi:hypothetical protein
MGDRWPQGLVVAVLRRVKPDERHHARVLRQDPPVFVDNEHIRRQAKSGDLGVSNADPVINSKDREHCAGTNPAAICRGQAELMRDWRALRPHLQGPQVL